MSGRAGGGGGNGVAATTSFPVSGIMPPAPPAARLQSQKNSTNPKIATHSSGNLLPISVPPVLPPSQTPFWPPMSCLRLFHKDNLLTSGVSGNSRSHPFPGMKASDSLPEFAISEAGIRNWKIVTYLRLPITIASSTILTAISTT